MAAHKQRGNCQLGDEDAIEQKGVGAGSDTREVEEAKRRVPPHLKDTKCAEINGETEWEKENAVKGLPGATVFYQHDFVDEEIANGWYERLSKLETWYRPTVSMHGQPYTPPRFITSYITSPALASFYSGYIVKVNYPYPPLIEEIRSAVSRKLGLQFDHVLLNWYQDGDSHIGKHRDSKENQVIASLSLGAKRTFFMHPHMIEGRKKVPDAEVRQWVLGNGSLLVMQGDTQKNWKHEVPKEPMIKEGRISLTFRQLGHQTS